MNLGTQTRITPDELLAIPNGKWCELVDGRLVELPSGAEAGWIGTTIRCAVGNFVRDHGLGHVFGPTAGYVCFPSDPNMVRKPDGSFIAKGRLPGGVIPKGHIPIAPDLAIEVISPGDSYYEVDSKVHLYREAGIRLIWVINPDNRTVKVYAQGRDFPVELTVGDTLDGGDVLPQFSVPVAQLFLQAE